MVGENWALKLAQISIWVIRTNLEILSPNGREKLGFETCSNLNWVIGPGLEILSLDGPGKIVCLIVFSYLYKFDH
jgi:hypothetical protein